MSTLEDLLAPKSSRPGTHSDDKLPESKEELLAYIEEKFEIHVPDNAVCPGHVAPADFLWEFFSGECDAALVMANRGGAKSFLGAMIHFLKARFVPGYDGISFGAIESQALRVYEQLRELLKKDCGDIAERHPDVKESIMKRTRFKNGSTVSVITASLAGVNGPRPLLAHADEVELMDCYIFQQCRHMTQSKDGHPAQDLLTSTRKRAHGTMDKLIAEIAEAEREGYDAPYKFYPWCCFETAARVENCGNGCGCSKVRKGTWDDGAPRTFDQICGGRLARSDGWITLRDLHNRFKKADRDVWEAEEECTRPSSEGLVVPQFRRDRHMIKNWQPFPEYGINRLILQGVDWGTTNPTAILWAQCLAQDAEAESFNGAKKLLKAGTLVVFDEIYQAEVAPSKLAQMVLDREQEWCRRCRWSANPRLGYMRWADEQGRSSAQEFAVHGLVISKNVSKDRRRQIAYIREAISDDELVIDSRVKLLPDELEAWHFADPKLGGGQDPTLPDKKAGFDHSVDALCYLLANWRSYRAQLIKHGYLRVGDFQAVTARHTGTGTSKSPWTSGQSPYSDHGKTETPGVPQRDAREEALFVA